MANLQLKHGKGKNLFGANQPCMWLFDYAYLAAAK
jgi:hypothetical protein